MRTPAASSYPFGFQNLEQRHPTKEEAAHTVAQGLEERRADADIAARLATAHAPAEWRASVGQDW